MSVPGITDDLLASESVPDPEAFPVPTDVPIEGPLEFAQPPLPSATAPGPDVLEAAWPPPVPLEAPGNIAAPAPMPIEVGGPPVKSGETEATIARQTELDTGRADEIAAAAEETARIARDAEEDDRLAYADYLERRKVAEDALAARTADYDANSKVNDPRERDHGRNVLAVIFGGLGAAQRAAGGGDSQNHVLAQLHKKWDDDTERQKANINARKDSVIMARTRLNDVDDARHKLRTEANAALVSRYNAALKQGEARLKRFGHSQAEIDGDKRVQILRVARAEAIAKAQKEADEHALAQAKLGWYKAKTARNSAAAGAISRGGDAMGKLADYAINNPGDIGGLHRLAATILPAKERAKAVQSITSQTKSTESEVKSAEFARAGLRSLGSIEKSKYVPTEAETQKWLNNQRDVYQAQEAGKGGGIGGFVGGRVAGGLQSAGLVAKDETEGLSPKAAEFFADVRRVMEPLGRAKSGAAISQGEWTNFFNQYGPRSSGGFAAARADLEDLLRASGTAGRKLASGDKPAEAAPAKAEWDEAITWAKAHKEDPRAREILKTAIRR